MTAALVQVDNVMKRPSKLSAVWTAGRMASRRLLGRSVGTVDAHLAEQLVDQLDQMKGMAMKVGQVMSYMDVPLPKYMVERLARLQTGAVGMPAEQVRQVLEAGLGAPTEVLFDEFDPAPVAAASIGQVHKARFAGRPVAVKVQYPHVAASFDGDMRLLRRIGALVGVATAADGQAIVDEIAARAQEECDYAREARHQLAFRNAFAGEADVRIPDVIQERSCRTVLTSEWVDLGMVGHSKRFDFEHHFRAMEYLYRPVLQPGFRFTDEYARESDRFNGLSNPNAFTLAIPPRFVWVLRLQLGLWAVLGKLKADADVTATHNALLEGPTEPLRPTPSGVKESISVQTAPRP